MVLTQLNIMVSLCFSLSFILYHSKNAQ